MSPSETGAESLSPYKSMFQGIFETRDKTLLYQTLRSLYDQVNQASTLKHLPSFPPEAEIAGVFENGQIKIDVGTGTRGQRVFVQYGPPHMPEGQGRIFMSEDQHGQEYREVFRKLFSLPENSYSFEF